MIMVAAIINNVIKITVIVIVIVTIGDSVDGMVPERV
jgi:hypothetical protein